MRSTLPILISGLGLFVALPAAAQAQGGPTPPPPANPPPAAAAPAEEPKAPATEPAPATAAPAVPAKTPESAPAADSNASTGGVVAMEGAKAAEPPKPVAAAATTESPSQRGAEAPGASDWKMEFHGYVRAPMRIGLGKRGVGSPRATQGQSNTTLHYPVIPDDQYLGWQFTSHNKKDWAEMFFSIGNSWAKGTLALQGFNFTDAAWADQVAQFGISQGFITLTPDLGYENVRLWAKAGSFWARYGLAGKWDAGEYDTYLFGRTHVMGELIHLDYDIDDATGLWFEHGIGTKRPDPSQFNNARFTLLNHAHAGIHIGSDIEFSAHYMHAWTQEEDRIIRQANVVPTGGSAVSDPYNPPNYPSTLLGMPDGKLWVAGADARFELGAFGYFYGGFSHIGAENAITVAPAFEVLHGFGGGQYQLGVTDVYFGPSCQASNTPGDYATGSGKRTTNGVPPMGEKITNNVPTSGYGKLPNQCSMGTGSVNSILAQYEFSLTNFRQISSGGQKFWGEGTDVKLTLYGMLNWVNSDINYQFNGKQVFDGIHKLKYGADLQYAALPWLTAALRFDRVQPNSNIPEQSFGILSPRLVFKSKWVTREQIAFSYSRYFYNQRECAQGASPAYNAGGTGLPADPLIQNHSWNDNQLLCVQPPAATSSAEAFGSHYENQDVGFRGAPTLAPDVNVFKVEASMWW
jgi:hypothetical protein